MKKLNKIFSVVLTAAIMTSLLVTSAIPAGAAVQAWDEVTTPSTKNMMLNTTITAGGPIAQSPVDGKLYAYVLDNALDNAVDKILVSEDGGRTWKNADSTPTTTPNFTVPVIDIIPSATEAGVIFAATADGVYRSDNFAGTFTPLFTVSGAADITSIDVGRYQSQYVIAVGTNALGDKTAGMYLWYETYLPGNLQQVGDTAFGEAVLDVALSPTFGTDRAIVGIGASGTVRVNVMGSDWGAIVPNNSVATGSFTNAQLALPSDFTTATPNYFVAITGAGVFRVQGTAETAIGAPTGKNNNAATNIVVDGTFASNAANLLVGFSDGTVRKSDNGGLSALSNVSLRSSINATSWVLFDNDFATNKKAYVLNVGGMGGAFNVTTDGSTYNQWSLVNETIAAIDDLAIASNGDLFIITHNTDGSAAIPAVPAGTFTITAGSHSHEDTAAVTADVLTITASAAGTVVLGPNPGASYAINVVSGGTADGNVITFTGAGSATVTALADGTNFSVAEVGTPSVITLTGTAGTVIGGAFPSWLVSLSKAAAPAVTHLETDTVVTLTGLTAASDVSIVTDASLSTTPTTIQISFNAVGQTAVVTCAAAADFSITATNTSGDTPTYTGDLTAAGTITFVAPVAAVPATNTSKIWRNIGGIWERVAVGITGDMIRVSPNYETDKAVFYTEKGSDAQIMVSTNSANKFSKMTTAPGSFVGGANTVESLFILDKDTVIVGSTGGVITKNNGPYIWIEKTTPSTDLSGFTVTDIQRAADGTLYAVGQSATAFKVAKSTDNGDTWSKLKVVGSPTTPAPDASQTGLTTSNAFLGLSDGQVFVAVDGGVYRYVAYNALVADTADGWLEVSTATADLVTGTAVIMGAGNSIEGNNALFVADGNNVVIDRILGVTSVVENTLPTDGLTTATPAVTGIDKIFAVGNTLCVIGDNAKIYSYTDTLVTPVTGVHITKNTTSSTGFLGLIPATSSVTIEWQPLLNATSYDWAIYDMAINAVGATLVDSGSTALTKVSVTGLDPDTTYIVYVWADDPVDSFFNFETFATKPVAPSTPIDLAPEAGAINVPVNPSFQWSVVPNATEYKVEVATDPNFSNIVKTLYTPIAAVAWNGESLTTNTVYYWRVAATTPTGTSSFVESVFTTVAGAEPPVTVTTTTQPQPNITLTVPPAADQETPGYIWIIIAIGGILTVLVIVLIVRTRRVV